MFTKPDDLADETILAALASGWGFEPVEFVYQTVGFGSHHWLAVAGLGDARFVTVNDLRANQLSTPVGTTNAAFVRFERAFRAARALGSEAGLDFVVAPLVGVSGVVLARLDERYAMVVQPYLTAAPAGENGEFRSVHERAAVLERIVQLHASTEVAAPYAGVEEGFLPGRRQLALALDAVGRAWATGPYGEPARLLLREHAHSVRELLVHFDRLVVDVCADRRQMVITHGEPHASNVLVDEAGPRLVDWESALIAPPERDLWVLDPGDGSILAAYTEMTGVALVEERLDYYRLWYDLFEIAGYVDLFRDPHTETADAAESWKNLVEFLQPEVRWPSLFR